MPFSKTSSGVIESSVCCFGVLCFQHVSSVFHSLPIQLSQPRVELLPSFHSELWITAVPAKVEDDSHASLL